jgi:hypothetical protein
MAVTFATAQFSFSNPGGMVDYVFDVGIWKLVVEGWPSALTLILLFRFKKTMPAHDADVLSLLKMVMVFV